MDIAISNLAFNKNNIDTILNILKKNNIKYIEGVLSKIEDINKINNYDVKKYNGILKKQDISFCSFQSIFFGSEINSFNDQNCIKFLNKIINLCKITDARILVLGSPNLRSKNSKKNLSKILKTIEKNLLKNNMYLCIEPNSKIFNGNYFYDLKEISEFIYENEYTNIKTMIDTFNLINEKFDPIEEYIKYKDIIKHIHVSEKNLMPISDKKFHYEFSNFIKKTNHIVTYELREIENIEFYIENFCKIYKN